MASRISKAMVKKAIVDSGGIILAISKRTGISYSTLHVWINHPKNQDIRDAIRHEKEKFLDLTETKLIKKVNAESDWAIKWVLATLGKNRGYAERQEVAHFGTSEIKVSFNEPSNEKIVVGKVLDIEGEKQK